jgi:NAD dependent epimerase/dehydratase family enzyme
VSKVAVTGASGLIGSALVAALHERGDGVVRLVRRPVRGDDEVRWDPASRHLDPVALDGVDAVVHLSGAGVGDHRWTPAYKREILTSRTDSTHAVATAVAATGRAVRLVSGSAVGVYGDRGEEPLTEDSPPGEGFLADVVQAWEAAAQPAVDAGAPVAFARTGLVMAPLGDSPGHLLKLDRSGIPVSTAGGAAGPLVRLARLGLAGPLGSGRQFWPWITLADEVGALLHLLDHPELTGPVNLVGPRPAHQREVATALAGALGRPAVLPVPGFAVRAVLGEFAGDILGSQRVVGDVLVRSGYAYEHADLDTAARWVAG